ncbi:selenide, water dikinase SelD [Bdellovibrionota bacterium FG-2]
MIRLTQTVKKGGCAAKVSASELRKILGTLNFPPAHPELIVDGRHFDDAAIYKVSETQAMVQTLDFFTPIVDDPRTFGRVSACNALSDVYAMGGTPKTAMAILAFPLMAMDSSVITEVLQGACDLLKEAKTCLVGGHSIDDDSLKFGLSVTGFVHPKRVWTNQAAQPGDTLILTKPLGTGTLNAALKFGGLTEADLKDVHASMGRLNNILDFLSEEQNLGIHAATDITGFGLSGHAWQMAKASQQCFEICYDHLPIFEKAPQMLQEEFLTKAHKTNAEYTANGILDKKGLNNGQTLILHDPQTSGGLLLSVAPEQATAIVSALAPHFPGVAIIGNVSAANTGEEAGKLVIN